MELYSFPNPCTRKDSASEAIGKDLTYRVTQKIPNWTGYEHYYLALNDTLGAGLDYGSLTSITVGGKAFLYLLRKVHAPFEKMAHEFPTS